MGNSDDRSPSRSSVQTPAFCSRREWDRLLGRPPQVLIAEDEQDIRVAIAEWFARDGWKTGDAGDGSEFFEKVEPILEGKQTDPDIDLIISDIAMPGIDVMDILRGLRQIGCEVPIIVVSALADAELPRKVEQLNMARFFAKPFSLEELQQAARYLLLAAHE